MKIRSAILEFLHAHGHTDRQTGTWESNGQMFATLQCKQARYDYVRVSVRQPLDRGSGSLRPVRNVVPDCISSHLRRQFSSCFYVLNIGTRAVVRNLQNVSFEFQCRT
jgi:hypothetical protein